MELGGKGPLIIFADADLDKAIGTACAMSVVNSGQFCGAATRIIVEESIHDEVVARMKDSYEQIKMGYWREEGSTKGPVISQNQMDKILGFIESGKQEGAQIVTGGSRMDRPGFFIEPTLFTGVTPEMRIAQEEIFGPVTSVLKFKSGENSVQDALSIANNC